MTKALNFLSQAGATTLHFHWIILALTAFLILSTSMVASRAFENTEPSEA
jgi:hypothetical protein